MRRRDFLKGAAHAVVAGAAASSARAQPPSGPLCHPYLQNVRGDRATIVWALLQSGAGAVRYFTDRNFPQLARARVQVLSPSQTGLFFPVYQYRADLTGLTPGTAYFYQVLVDQQVLTREQENRFRTAAPGAFALLVFGDSGRGTPEQLTMAQRMLQEDASLVLHTGDIAYTRGSFSDFQSRYFDIYANPDAGRNLMGRVPFFTAPGNHDYDTDNAAPYLALHSLPAADVSSAEQGRYYSFDWGGVHFVALDSNAPLVNAVNGSGEMLRWLDRDLERTRAFWKVVFFHHPPFASGPNENDPLSALARQHVVPIVERHNVQLVLNGHEHSYQRTDPIRAGRVAGSGNGTMYLTTGGGGAFTYPVSQMRAGPTIRVGQSVHHYLRIEVQSARMVIRAIRLDGAEIDRVSFAPPPEVSSNAIVNSASFTMGLAPGGLATIFGRNLAEDAVLAHGFPLPVELSNISVSLNGRRLPLLFAAERQVNFQLPFDVAGPARLAITGSNGSLEISIAISETAPAIFSVPGDGGPRGAILHQSGALVSPANPAAPGEALSIYLTGLGRVVGEIAAGQAAPSSPLLRVRAPVAVRVGPEAAAAAVSYAGLAPGFAGLYQINFEAPASLTPGVHPLRVLIAGGSSNVVNLAVGA